MVGLLVRPSTSAADLVEVGPVPELHGDLVSVWLASMRSMYVSRGILKPFASFQISSLKIWIGA